MQPNNATLALDALLRRHENLFKSKNKLGLPNFELDEPWPSACIEHQDEHNYYWRHKSRDPVNIFLDIEKAIEIPFHPDLHTYYSSFWSNGICVEHCEVEFSLIQIWNEDDQERLKENILGHCFAKLKARQALTLFIGCADNNEILSIENETGKVIIERPGQKGSKLVAEDLESFLISASPITRPYS